MRSVLALESCPLSARRECCVTGWASEPERDQSIPIAVAGLADR